ncbi:MAG: HNH endonuclease signature motif containing protein [Prosthecobacter sp.]|nr:HNH endonuclease signature motif containing protein [Prosthecobacter sp.]
MTRRSWTQSEIDYLRKHYADTATHKIGQAIDRTERQCYHKAQALGLKKCEAYLYSQQSGRFMGAHGQETRFQKGHTTWNKGKKGWNAGGRSAAHRFTRGIVPHNHKPVGTIITNTDGYLKQKIAEPNKWRALQRIVWEEHHGPVPPGTAITFIDGNKSNCDIDNLRLISRAELMQRNTIHRYPTALKETIRMAAKLNREITHHEKQD